MSDKPTNPFRKLTQKEQLFVEEYLKSFNATQSAIRAGYSETSSRAIGQENLTKHAVRWEINEVLSKRTKAANITQERVIQELRRIAFADLTHVTRWNESGVTPIPSDELQKQHSASISEVSEHVNAHASSIKIKQHDKLKALELLGKFLSMWKDIPEPPTEAVQGPTYPSMTRDQAKALLKEKK